VNLCVDRGNSSTKIGVFDNEDLLETLNFSLNEEWDVIGLCNKYDVKQCILSSVVNDNESLLSVLRSKVAKVIELDHVTPLPIINNYKTPETLGKDRLAAVVGANFIMPNTNVLVIDAAGITLRLRSLHEFTQKLPLVEVLNESTLLGYDTNSALISGALNGVIFEIDGYINHLKIKYTKLSTFLTGGSIFYFDTKLKSAIFAEKNLVLIGLNRILQYNV